jgi:hypothetical protein
MFSAALRVIANSHAFSWTGSSERRRAACALMKACWTASSERDSGEDAPAVARQLAAVALDDCVKGALVARPGELHEPLVGLAREDRAACEVCGRPAPGVRDERRHRFFFEDTGKVRNSRIKRR